MTEATPLPPLPDRLSADPAQPPPRRGRVRA